MPSIPSIARTPPIVIAAGGAGSRIGGNKAARLLGEQSLLAHVVNWARRSSDSIAIAVAASAKPEIDRFGLPLLRDVQANLGPISALQNAMSFARIQQSENVMLVGCDMPFLPTNLVPRLVDAIGSSAAAVPSSGGRLQPLAALWRTDVDQLNSWIAGGGRSLWAFAESSGMATVEWPFGENMSDRDPFTNINTLADIELAVIELAKSDS